LKNTKALVLYSSTKHNKTFSYQTSWPAALKNHNLFDCTMLNVSSYRYRTKLLQLLSIKMRKIDLIIIMHSVFSNSNKLGKGWLHDALVQTNIPKIYFIGNEYKLMPEKMKFSEKLQISMLVSQSNSKKIHEIYEEQLGCKIIGLPNTGIDPNMFKPINKIGDREIDIGYRATAGTLYLGHNERNSIADYFEKHAVKYNLVTDISTDESKRFNINQWVNFLNQCKGQIGSEAGTDYFELTDSTRLKVNQYVDKTPNVTFEDVYEKYFRNYGPKTPNRMISGRNVEAGATKTVQILFEGEYGGYFQPDIHYIPLKKDFTNFDEVIDKFSDSSYSNQIATNAYDLVMSELTYDKILNKFHQHIKPIL